MSTISAMNPDASRPATVGGGVAVHGGIAGVLKMLGAGVWAVALGVIGFWVLVGTSLPGFLGGLSVVERVCVGMGMLCGGQLVFLMLVAERIFPGTPKRLSTAAHWVLFVFGVVCVVVVVFNLMIDGGA